MRKARQDGLGFAWRIGSLAESFFAWFFYVLAWLIVLVVPLLVVFDIAFTLWNFWYDCWFVGLVATLVVAGAGTVAFRWLARP